MTTIGFGDLHPNNPRERLATMVLMLFGVSMYAVMVGSVTSVIHNANQGLAAFEMKMSEIRHYLRYRNVSTELRQRAHEFFETMYPQRVLFNEQMVLAMMPTVLRNDIKMDMYKNMMDSIPFFSDIESESEHRTHHIRLTITSCLVPCTFM
jgi:hypothetical protein